MPCAYLYTDRSGCEIFRLTDVADQLPIPAAGETIRLLNTCYLVESVKMVESLSPASLATEYCVRVLLIEESLPVNEIRSKCFAA